MIRTLLLGFGAALLAGCSSPAVDRPELVVPGGSYAVAFEAARETLLAARFEIDRVDARAGVITTHPKPTAGLATPWDGEQSTLGQEIDDLLNDHRRWVEIRFEPRDAQTPDDLREAGGDLDVRIRAVLERGHRPGWRVESAGVRLSSRTQDPSLGPRDMWPSYSVAMSRDERLEADLLRRIARRMERARERGGDPS